MEIWAGEIGCFQWGQFCLLVLPAFLTGLHTISQVPLTATPEHRCRAVNDTIVEYVGKCHYISVDNETLPCQAWEYNTTQYSSTVVTQWDLVCERRWMSDFCKCVYMFGILCSAVSLGQLADRYGRWKVLWPASTVMCAIVLGCSFSPNYVVYTLLRFCIGFNVGGTYMISFVMTMEMLPDRYRTPMGMFLQLIFALGSATSAAWSFVFRDWAYLEMALAGMSTILLMTYWLVEESPCWLFSVGRYDEAEKIVRKALMRNNRQDMIPENGFSHGQLEKALSSADLAPSSAQNSGRKYGIADLYRTPRLRSRTLNISLNWFANSLVYYGLSLNMGNLNGNPILMVFISSIIEVPGCLLAVAFNDRIGRRLLISLCLCGGGLACIITTYFPQDDYTWTVLSISLVMTGKMLVAASYAILYNYTAELFPTAIRSSALGVGSFFAGISGTLTPFVIFLDVIDPKLPSVLFGVTALVAGIATLDLPETLGATLLHTVEDGEAFGSGDSLFARLGRRLRPHKAQSQTKLS